MLGQHPGRNPDGNVADNILAAPHEADFDLPHLFGQEPEVAGINAERTLDARNAYVMTSMMQDVTRSGTAAKARVLGRADLVLAVGHAAAERALRDSSRPVLAVLVGLRDLDRLKRAHPARDLGAVVLDQPLERHLRLVRAVLPDAKRVGVLLGPDSVVQLPGLQHAADALRLQADVHEVREVADLVPALDHLLFAGDALLPLPDGLVSGPAAARTILLTSYRHRRPVFAHSAAYVTAGALAAVFSTPEHVAVDVADLLAAAKEPAALVRKIHSPRRFDVAVNRAVARALGLVVADEQVLRERIADGGAQ